MGKQMTGSDVQSKHHRVLLDYRRQDYIIKTEAFEEAFDTTSPARRIALLAFLESPNPDELRRLITKIMLGGVVTIVTLKKIAQTYGIRNYSRMTKFELEDELSTQGVKI